MRPAISNIALPPYKHIAELAVLRDLELEGLEVAPSRVWRDTWKGLSSDDVERYRHDVEAAGLRVIGLHSLFFDHPELGLFKPGAAREATIEFLVHLSTLCRDLGGHTLIYGGGRKRGNIALKEAFEEAIDVFGEVCQRIEGHGTCYCFEPLGLDSTDFINSAFESLEIVKAVDHPCLKVQLDAKALIANAEAVPETFNAVAGHLVHYHANEPDLGPLGTSGAVDHAAFGRMLQDIGYDGYVSIEQRMIDETDPLAGIRQSAQHLKECYA
jgi:sugar phosphate isomerase/epimerase